VLFNLISNAVKFTSQGGIAVRVRAQAAPAGRARLRFEVNDTGIGLAPEAVQRLFSPFVQADASITRQYGGTGLGLAICKKLVGLLGGEIGVDSTPGLGSTFWFTLEADIGDPGKIVDPAESVVVSAPPEGLTGRHLRVLVAEDNHINQKVVSSILKAVDCVVDLVANGQEAVTAAGRSRYDVILMDVQMPEMDGTTAARLIRDQQGASSATPIIALTANAMKGDRERYLASGMTDYVAKPIDPRALFAAIAHATSATGTETEAPRSAPSGADRTDRQEPGGAAEIPVLDGRTHAQLQQVMSTEQLRSTMAEFSNEGARLLREIGAGIANGDLDAARRSAHALRGMASNLGALRLAAIARELELRAPSLEAVSARVGELSEALRMTEDQLSRAS